MTPMPGRDWLSGVAALVSQLAGFSATHARLVASLVLAVAVGCAVYAAQHFEISTDLDALLDPHLPWRVQALNLERTFPGQGDDITLVIDAVTPECAETGAAALTAALTRRRDLFASVDRLNGGAFFDQEGLLYQSRDTVRQTTAALIAAQPLLAQTAQDPSLRGLLSALRTGAGAPAGGAAQLQLAQAADQISSVIETRQGDRPHYLSWRRLISGENDAPRDWRQFISIIPKLDYASAAPSSRAIQAIRDSVSALALNTSHGVLVRITGSAPIADEELATLAESSGPAALVMLACMIGVLYLATGSARAVAATLLTIIAGAAITCAGGLWLFGRFNLVSIAFLPLFFGLGVDFCIQFLARCSAEDSASPTRITEAAHHVGAGLALAAGSMALAFFSFVPTAYRGVAELGMIAGLGMVVAFALCMSLLPALLGLMGARLRNEHGLAWLGRLEKLVVRRRLLVLWGSALAAFASVWMLPLLVFDFDPMHLRNPHTEAVSLYYEMTHAVETTPNIVNLTVPHLSAAQALATRLERMPQIGHALTLAGFIPADQDAKLAMIADARDLLDFSVNPFAVLAPPTDAERVMALRQTAATLLAASAGAQTSPRAQTALARLADDLLRLSQSDIARRNDIDHALMQGLPVALTQMRSALQAQPITLARLPDALRRAWLSPDGIARIEVAPAAPVLTPAQNQAFVGAVRRIAPNGAGDAVTIVESGRTIVAAFAIAGAVSAFAIALFLRFSLGNWRWVGAALAPVLLAGLMSFGVCALCGFAINLENMIALPLLLGIGVAFNIYLVTAWRRGERQLLGTSLGRGVLFSAATTALSFSALLLSAHPGTASMGALLLISLLWIAIATLVVTPALLAAFDPEVPLALSSPNAEPASRRRAAPPEPALRRAQSRPDQRAVW